MTCKTCNGSGEIDNAPIPDNTTWDDIGDCPDCTGQGKCPSCDTEWSDDTLAYYRWCVNNLHINKFSCPFCGWQGGGE